MDDTVKCPHCGKERDDLWDDFSGFDNEEAVVECYGCEKEYTIMRHVSITYTTDPDPEFEKFIDELPGIREQLEKLKARITATIKE